MIIGFAVFAIATVAFVLFRALVSEPAPTSPEGAYVRVAARISSGDAKGVYALLDDRARDACARLSRARKEASALVESTFPEPDRTRLLAEYEPIASAADLEGVWLALSSARGYATNLRRDLSGVASVERDVEADGAATIVTARGARYPFTRRSDGTWGLSLFTEEIVTDAWRAERDLEIIQASSADYARVPPRAAGSAPR